MAFSTKVTFVAKLQSEKSFVFDMVDYNLNKDIIRKSKLLNFNMTESNGYTDFILELSVDEFLAFHNVHFDRESYRSQELLMFVKTRLNSIPFEKVVIEVYEWETGLDL